MYKKIWILDVLGIVKAAEHNQLEKLPDSDDENLQNGPNESDLCKENLARTSFFVHGLRAFRNEFD